MAYFENVIDCIDDVDSTKGQTFGPKLLFQPIPKSVLVVAEKTITKIHG